MPFTNDDRFRIIQALHLDIRLDSECSILARLMAGLAECDLQNGTTYVDKVLASLCELDCLREAIDRKQSQLGLAEYEITYEFRKEFTSGSGAIAGELRRMEQLRGQIRQYLDPDHCLVSYGGSRRIIQT